jgi:hypothetical protein
VANPTYVVPAGKTAVLRTVTVSPLFTSGSDAYVLYLTPYSVCIVRGQIGAVTGTPGDFTHSWDLHVAIAAGEGLWFSIDTNLAVIASGYLFSD